MVAAAAGANQGAAMAAQRVRSLLMRSDVPVAAVLVASSIAGDPSLVSGMGGLVATQFLGTWARHLTACNRSAGLGGARAAPNGLPTVPCGGSGTTPGSKTTALPCFTHDAQKRGCGASTVNKVVFNFCKAMELHYGPRLGPLDANNGMPTPAPARDGEDFVSPRVRASGSQCANCLRRL